MPISDQKMKKLKVAMIAPFTRFTIYLCFRNYKTESTTQYVT